MVYDKVMKIVKKGQDLGIEVLRIRMLEKDFEEFIIHLKKRKIFDLLVPWGKKNLYFYGGVEIEIK